MIIKIQMHKTKQRGKKKVYCFVCIKLKIQKSDKAHHFVNQ